VASAQAGQGAAGVGTGADAWVGKSMKRDWHNKYSVEVPGKHDETNEIFVDEYRDGHYHVSGSLGWHLELLEDRIAALESELQALKGAK